MNNICARSGRPGIPPRPSVCVNYYLLFHRLYITLTHAEKVRRKNKLFRQLRIGDYSSKTLSETNQHGSRCTSGWLVEKSRESPQGRTNARSEKDSPQVEAKTIILTKNKKQDTTLLVQYTFWIFCFASLTNYLKRSCESSKYSLSHLYVKIEPTFY